MKMHSFFAMLLLLGLNVSVYAQNQGESDMIDIIEGCHPKAKPSCQARIICTGITVMSGKNPRDVQTAMRIANSRANSQLALYLGNKAKIAEDIKELERNYSKEDSQGSSTQKEFGQLLSSVSSQSAEQYLQGVAVIGGKIDMEQGKVSVVVGQSCETISAAQSLTQRTQQGPNSQPSSADSSNQNNGNAPINSGVGGPNLNVGTPKSSTQKQSNDF